MPLDALQELPPNTIGEKGHVYIRLHEEGRPVYIGKAKCHQGKEYAVFGCQDGGNPGVVAIPVAKLAHDDASSVIPKHLRVRAQTFVSLLPETNFLYHPSGALSFPYTGPNEPAGEVVAMPMEKNAFFGTGKIREILTTTYGLKGAARLPKMPAFSPDRPGVLEPLGVKLALDVH